MKRVEREFAGRKLKLEAGRLAKQSAGSCLIQYGETVVLDASWNSAERRTDAADVAARTHSRLVPLRCWAPESTTAARLANRKDSISDATPEIAQHMSLNVHPWPEAHIILTAGTECDSLTQAMAYLTEP